MQRCRAGKSTAEYVRTDVRTGGLTGAGNVIRRSGPVVRVTSSHATRGHRRIDVTRRLFTY